MKTILFIFSIITTTIGGIVLTLEPVKTQTRVHHDDYYSRSDAIKDYCRLRQDLLFFLDPYSESQCNPKLLIDPIQETEYTCILMDLLD